MFKGLRVYDEVYAKLVETARKGKRINYAEIGEIMRITTRGSAMARKVGQILDEINEDEHNNGRPMISAVVVNKQCGIPGAGFYNLARKLRKLKGVSDLEELEFWLKEVRTVFDYWNKK